VCERERVCVCVCVCMCVCACGCACGCVCERVVCDYVSSVCVFMCERVCMCHKTASHRSIDATCVCVCVPGWETVCTSACLCVCVSVCVKESEGVCLFVCRHTHTWRRTSRISSRVPLNHLGSVSTEIPAQPACAYLSPCSPARIFGAISDECCTQRQRRRHKHRNKRRYSLD